jgi:cell wall-associated NlpC family hydrolase
MTDGLSAIQARVSQLRALVDPTAMRARSTTGTTGAGTATTSTAGTTGTDFQSALADAIGTQLTPAGSAAGGDLGEQAVSVARTYLGVPYRWGGTDPKTGLDCSGLTKLVYSQLGVDLPRVSRDQAKVGTKVDSLAQAKPGDLVFFDEPVDHVGIYVGDGKLLDAPKTGDKVRIRDVWETPSHIRRVLPDAPTLSAASVVGAGGTTASGGLSGPYASLFTAAGRKYGVDPALLSAVAKAESSYNPRAVSHAGAKGLMQLMPGTARDLGVDALNPADAVDGAARLLSGHLRSFGGRVDLALAAYNAGPGNVRKYGGVPPFEETRNYVQRVTRYWGDLR